VSAPLEVEPWQLEVGDYAPDLILDLREPEAFSRGHLVGAQNLPYRELQGDPPPAAGRVLLVCPAGARAAEMAVWLRRRGVDASSLAGGYAAWTGPLEAGPAGPR